VTSTNAAVPGEPPEGIGLPAFNAMPDGRAREVLLGCCRAAGWAEKVAAGRPYTSLDSLLTQAGAALTDEDVTEALAGHPRIGDTRADTHSSWSRGEQAGVSGSDDTMLAELAAGNRAYEERFGHIYLVCAAGRSAAELLAILRDRLSNDPDTERQVTRGELRKINELRLTKLLGSLPQSYSARLRHDQAKRPRGRQRN
jgi:2-oxo-4-hydroxy-4-carboxy-5-ureidoimidazoline decarboxylase